jgi:LemA protein
VAAVAEAARAAQAESHKDTTMNIIGIAILVVCGTTVVWFAAIYNILITLRNRCANASSQIDVQLKLRYELVPKLVQVVKGYTEHERETLERVTEARTRALSADSLTDKAVPERELEGALKTLFAVVEGYPELKASEEYLRLHDELTEIEDQIRFARQFYNDIVMRYNTKREIFPNIFVANLFRFKEAEYFDLDE